MRLVYALCCAALVSGCGSVPKEVFTGSTECAYIGCSTGGLQVYPNEKFSASVQPRRWYGWEWGQTSSAYPPGHPKHQELKIQEAQRMRQLGLDPMGRPLY
jgi:hypothetical protein